MFTLSHAKLVHKYDACTTANIFHEAFGASEIELTLENINKYLRSTEENKRNFENGIPYPYNNIFWLLSKLKLEDACENLRREFQDPPCSGYWTEKYNRERLAKFLYEAFVQAGLVAPKVEIPKSNAVVLSESILRLRGACHSGIDSFIKVFGENDTITMNKSNLLKFFTEHPIKGSRVVYEETSWLISKILGKEEYDRFYRKFFSGGGWPIKADYNPKSLSEYVYAALKRNGKM